MLKKVEQLAVEYSIRKLNIKFLKLLSEVFLC